jgi:Endonuclease/Exonuclease/phosphatase family
MAFDQKRHLIQNPPPDIAVIPECSQSSIQSSVKENVDCRWFGENPHKGLGVMVAKPWQILRSQEPKHKWIVPVWIGGPTNFLLLAVWTARIKESHERSYIGQLCEAVRGNPSWFNEESVVLCGDFNSNVIWDKTRRVDNHSFVVKFLAERNIVSAYHHYFSELEGEEKRPTHFFYHQKKRGYHIDYVFLPSEWAKRIKVVEVGEHQQWAKYSDHVPLVVEVI